MGRIYATATAVLTWFAIALLRGTALGWYPYTFLDANALGYARVSANAVMLLAACLVTGLVFVAIGRWTGRTATKKRT